MSDDHNYAQFPAPATPNATSEEVGYSRTQSDGPRMDENFLRTLLEAQNRNLMALIDSVRPVSNRKIILPDFDPEKADVDARAWCTTVDLCLAEQEQHGSALILALSGALKGNASQWLSQVSFPGMTWHQFKDLFLARYGLIETPAATIINMQNSKPKDNENMASYAARLSTTLMARFKDMTTEQITLAMVLAHVSQFDGRLQRTAFTTEIKTREQLQRELQASCYMKRKNMDSSSDVPNNKRPRPGQPPPGPVRCFSCGKLGHRSTDCRSKDPKRSCDRSTFSKASSTKQQPNASGVTCYRCGLSGHFANKCPRASNFTPGKNASGNVGANSNSGAAAASTSNQRRVDLCSISNPTGRMKIADCLHLQLYRDPKDRFKKGQTKASLSLQQFLGFESGFTLDKESNTIAIICQDVIVVLAFETRERLIAWQVKVGGQLGSSKEWLVLIGGGSRKLPPGPARLHLQGRRFALTSGVPPRLLGLWELAHLRRYGVVEGRFCFEGGSHCGKGEGLHVLITDQAQDITDGFDAATHGNPRAPASRKSGGADRNRPDTRLSDLNADQSIPDTGLYEENFFGEDCGGVSPFWPSDEGRGFDDHDCKCKEPGARPPWSGADHVTLERCSNCVTKLGTMTRSSTIALTPGTHFNPAWTMEPVPESSSDNSSNSTEYLTPRAIKKSLEASQCKEWAPQRPPKPPRLEEIKAPAPLPIAACTCTSDRNSASHTVIVNNPKVGPYENYDVPKTSHVEMESANEYYDTPKRIKKALAEDLFQVTKNSVPGNLVLKKNCGCILKFGSKKKPVIVECDENIQPVECPCQKVTNWANNLISLPYCKRSVNYDKINTEVLTGQKAEEMALYATVDVSRKTNRQSSIAEKESLTDCNDLPFMNYENLEPKGGIEFEDPYANYENLEFALSLEYYENAKDLLKKAGVTQTELDALSANVDFADAALPPKPKHCAKCGHSAKYQALKKNKSDEYLLMEPPKDIKRDLCRTTGPNPGYTPMSPNPNWSQSLRHPLQKLCRVDIEKSLSIPTLNGSANRTQSFEISSSSNNNKEAIQKRSSSVDSARLLEDLKEFDSSIGSHATSSSLETLRNLAIENRRSSSPCDNERDCCDHDCCKSSDSENKTSEGSCSKDIPHLRNKHMDNAQIKRSSSVPCKSGGNRDSSSSNDSGVSSCSMKHGSECIEFEMPLTSGHSRYQYMAQRRMRGNATGCIHSSLPRKSKSSDPLRDMTMQIHKANVPAKSSSAEAEVPVLPPKQFKGVMDTHSTSSGTSDMSDYIETLSLTSSHSSSDNPNLRLARQPTTTLRPRSGKEYHNLDPIITSMYKSGKELSNYTNLP